MVIDTVSTDGERINSKNFICKDKKTYAKKMDDTYVYTYVNKGKNKVLIQARNQKGKVKKSCSIKIDKKDSRKIKNIWVDEHMIKGNKIYYVLETCTKKDKRYYYIQCYNLKKKKVVSSKKIKGYTFYQFNNNKLYCRNVDDSTVEEYALNGKKTSSYALPEGETTITGHLLHLNGLEYKYGFKAVDYHENYIYYCNRNGVYRCDTEGDGAFELIYDGSKDAIFNPAYGEERNLDGFKVLGNDNFFIKTDNYENSNIRGFIYKKQ